MPGAHDHDRAGRIPFWVHQLVELLLAVLLLVEGARTGEHTVVLVSLGAALLLLALCSDGALGAWPWIGRRLHRVLDLVAALVLAASPLVLGLDRVLAIVLIELAALAMVWLALRTEWRPKAERTKATRTKATRPEATRTAAASPAIPSVPAPPVARQVGTAVARVRDEGPRQLGRLVGRAQRAAKAALATPDAPASPSERPPAASDPPDAPPS
jgi:hypothetical protein